MKDEKTRTRRDIDIIKQSSLKAAVDLTAAILPTLENNSESSPRSRRPDTEISDLALQLADKFANWVFGDQVQSQVDRIHEALNNLDEDHPDPSSFNGYQDYSFAENPYSQALFHEAHRLQDTLAMPRSDFFSPCTTHASWEQGGVHDLVERLRKQVHEALAYGKKPGGNGDSGGNGNGKMTPKQRRYIFALLKETGERKPDNLSQYTAQEASALIDSLKALQDPEPPF